MRSSRRWCLERVVALLALLPWVLGLMLAVPAIVAAATLNVSNTGVDGSTCGGVGSCRSITRAVANAAPGDSIVVGPGLYSADLDGDGIGNEPGEEATIIFLDKPLRITSKFGASSTLVRNAGFWVTTSGVVLGKLNNGFTITPSQIPVVVIDGSIAGNFERLDVRVEGNVITLEGDFFAGIFAANTRGRLEHNRVIGRGECINGLYLTNSWDVIARNVAMGCETGFHQDAGATVARLVRNTAIGNGTGFNIGKSAEFTGNAAIGNGFAGVVLSPNAQVPLFRDNAFIASHENCGVFNDSSLMLDASGNYWGAATGPGPDPADTICDGAGSVTVTAPFLTTDPTQAQFPLR
jgi:hypothetical protein